MFKVLLIVPPLYTEETYGKFGRIGSTLPFLGLCYIASVLRKNDFEVRILDSIVLRLSIKDILKEIDGYHPNMIGISSTTASYHKAKALAEASKGSFPDINIVIGGPHLSGSPQEVMKNRCFNFGIINEGEETILDLCKKLINGDNNFREIKGLTFRNNNDEIVVTKEREPIKDIDGIPYPARDLLPPLKTYRASALYYKRLPIAQIFTSRGCPYQCIFCDTPFGKVVRFHSAEYVVSEIEMLLKDFGVKEILVNDDTFTVNKMRVLDICRLIRKKKLKFIWSCNIRVNAVDKEILLEMKSAGCWLVMPGVESGNQDILGILRKGLTLEQAQNACNWAKEAGLAVKPSFICGNPGDTEGTIEETIRFAKSLKTHYPSYTFMTPFPGTDMWHLAEKYGYIDKSDFTKFALSSREPSFVPFGLTKEYLVRKQAEAFRRWYFDWGMFCRHLSTIRGIEDIRKMFRALLTLLGMCQ